MNLNFIDMTTEVINKEVSLSRKNVADVFVPKQIAWVSVGTPLEDVLKVLKENSILSVPVMDLVTNKCLGTIDVLDIASFVVTRYPNINEVTGDSLRDLEVSGYYFGKQTTAGQLIGNDDDNENSDGNEAWSKGLFNPQMPQFVELTTPVLGLTDLFAQGIHRVPVIDTSNENKLISFISQSDLLRFFAEHLYVLGSLGDKTVQDLGLVSGGVHFVTGNARTILALNLIANKRVSAVPVVDSEGVLRCSISASDLRGLGPQQFDELLKPVAEYLTLWSPKSLFPLVCKPYHTLEYVVLKLAATKVHRLWVVDDFGKLLGVISITDVMKTFIRSPMDVGYQGFTLEPSTATATYGYLDVKNV